jgi:hypothetical protein
MARTGAKCLTHNIIQLGVRLQDQDLCQLSPAAAPYQPRGSHGMNYVPDAQPQVVLPALAPHNLSIRLLQHSGLVVVVFFKKYGTCPASWRRVQAPGIKTRPTQRSHVLLPTDYRPVRLEVVVSGVKY